MPRPRSFDEESVLDSITRLFWEQGYKATTTAQIVARSGLREPSLYGAFGNKAALFARCLHRYIEHYASRPIEAAEGTADPLERLHCFVRTFVDAVLDPETPIGCFLTNALAEARTLEPALQEEVAAARAQLETTFRAWFAAARDAGQIRPGANPEEAAAFLLSQMIGIGITAQLDPALVEPSARAFSSWLDGLAA